MSIPTQSDGLTESCGRGILICEGSFVTYTTNARLSCATSLRWPPADAAGGSLASSNFASGNVYDQQLLQAATFASRKFCLEQRLQGATLGKGMKAFASTNLCKHQLVQAPTRGQEHTDSKRTRVEGATGNASSNTCRNSSYLHEYPPPIGGGRHTPVIFLSPDDQTAPTAFGCIRS